VPWGISEAAYNVRDLHLNYQYGPFGVPGLGLKRGLIEDLVVAPTRRCSLRRSIPRRAMENLRRLRKEGALGPYGFTSRSITPRAPAAGQKRAHSRLHDSPSGHEPRRAQQ
jgi:cyclic beta-1,2-glucan synthetase